MTEGFGDNPDDDTGRNGVFSDTVKSNFDKLAKSYGNLLRHQSDRDYARALFQEGITSDSKKYGAEERCRLMLCLLIFCSKHGVSFDDEMTGHKSSLYVHVLTQMLLLESFMRESVITYHDIVLLKKYMPILLDRYKSVVDRQKGAGMEFVKFHLPLHLADDLLRIGPASTADSSAGESNHKGFKQDARQTQKNTDTFDRQTANRNAQTIAINRARRGWPSMYYTTAGC